MQLQVWHVLIATGALFLTLLGSLAAIAKVLVAAGKLLSVLEELRTDSKEHGKSIAAHDVSIAVLQEQVTARVRPIR